MKEIADDREEKGGEKKENKVKRKGKEGDKREGYYLSKNEVKK